MCSIIQNSGNTLLRIINDILDYSKIESGNFDFNFDSFKIKNLVNEVVMANKHRALKKQIDLKITFKDLRFDSVITDRDRLAQVLYNVIGNAIKFTDHGSVNLIVEILDIDKKQFLSLKVKDTGIGIRDSECDKVFTPFIQIQSQGTSGEPGSGLGLSISKKIVERLKGELSFKSYYGIGTEFTIQIPIQKGKENTNEIFSQNNSSLQIWNKIDIQAAKDLAQAPKLIFIAEDNPTNQIVISTMLKNEDARHILFSNGKELLEALDTTLPRFILMDCQMPVMDGYEATQLVKQNFPNIPIIAMTADATEKNQDLCKSINFDGIMIKPLSIKAVNDLLVEYGLTTAKNDIRNLVTAKSSISVPLTGIPKSISDLDERFGKDKRIKIISAFTEQIQNLDFELNEKVKTKNLGDLKRVGHKLKSSCQLIGAEKFCELFTELEKSDDFELSKKITAEIIAEKKNVSKILIKANS